MRRTSRLLSTFLATVCVLAVSSGEAQAQATAQITGAVRDQSGAVLPGVEVTATQTGTGITRTAITNETGSYVLPNLPLGPYRLEAALPGFRTYAQTGIVLQVNSSPAVNITLEVGEVAETIEVLGSAALVETRNVGVGQLMENTSILELPLNGRAMIELVALSGAATPADTVTGSNRDPFTRGNVSVAGGLSTGLLYTLDGATHHNYHSGGYLSMPFPDAMEEFKVETSATSAQTGVKSAGSVSLVTKSGTNEYHGNAFEFVRNGIFNARNAFAKYRDTIKRNQYGGTIGGPIMWNRLFFFAGYQGTTIRQDPAEQIAFIPTAAMMSGDFTAFASPACNRGRQIVLAAPFANNRVNPALFSTAAVRFSRKLPATNDPCGQIIYSNRDLQNEHVAIGRIDYQHTPNHSIFGRYLAESVVNPTNYDLDKDLLVEGQDVATDGLAQAFTIGSTYLFNSNVVNALRLSANRMAGGKFSPDYSDCECGPAALGIRMFSQYPDIPGISVNSGFSISSPGGATRVATFGASNDLSVLTGSHQMAFGVNASAWWVTSKSTTYSQSSFDFNGQTYGLGLADFLMGAVFTHRIGTDIAQSSRSKYVGVYASDTWNAHARLTVNYGVRWEPYFPQINIDGTSIHYDEDALRKGIKTRRFDNAPPGLFFDGDPGFPDGTGMHNKWWNFSPRLGLAWDVKGDGRTSVRASGGIFYDYPAAIYQRSLTTVPPWAPRYFVNNVKFDDPWSDYPGGDPFPMPYGGALPRDVKWTPFSVVTAMDYDSPNMRVGQWNLSIQRQLGTDWLVSASYLGNATRHLWTTQPINPVRFIPGTGNANGNCFYNGVAVHFRVNPGAPCSITANTDQRRRLMLEDPVTGQWFGYVNKIDTGGTASYNGLVLNIQRRAARGVAISANYTWSHCITDKWQETAQSGNANSGWNDPDNRRFDRGNCNTSATDRRHVFNANASVTTPQFSNSTLRALASSWRLSPILRILSGSFMQVTTSQDRALSGMSGQRVNQLMADVYGEKTISNYLNPAAFAMPTLGTLGNLGLGSIEGPGTWQFDVAISRMFQVTEAQRLEFRAEAFNVTNSFRMGNPVTNFNAGNFGQVTSARDPRIMQFALKYFF